MSEQSPSQVLDYLPSDKPPVGATILITGIGGSLALENGLFPFVIPGVFPSGIPAIVFSAIAGILMNLIFVIFKPQE
jgi:hypothetical protein